MVTHQGAEPGSVTPTAGQVLDELDFLATLEHALVVEYLWVQCALGHDVLPSDGTPFGDRVVEAAQAAFESSVSAMRRLRRVNEALVLAGRPAQLGRAAAIGTAGGDIAFRRPGPDEPQHLADRETAIAKAADARYKRLRPAVEPPAPVFDGDLLPVVELAVAVGLDHAEALHDFRTKLAGVPPQRYLRAVRHEPASDAERSLLGVADRYYGLIVAMVRAGLAHDAELAEGGLLHRAVLVMDGLNDIHRLLVARGLLPAFTTPTLP